MTLLELAERCEKATGPDFDLSFAIWQAAIEPIAPSSRQPDYTASLDAAMTLVPEGWFLSVSTHPEGAFAVAVCQDLIGKSDLRVATAALALCAAALKARAAKECVSNTPEGDG
jgi:hypothetical protein